MVGIGAILAGGRSERFGSDKADARIGGRRLIDHVAIALGSQVSEIVVCGRNESGRRCLVDHPAPGLGPLGGLAAALQFADEMAADFVLSSGCDTPNLPTNLLGQLHGEGPAIVES
ncbi:molybdenum cofactor guanylyltransferase [Parasphingopyxis sp. CP4]|uniref:molybdenum cofactor guanylyltransferase n=1 Tax=Parasphingopyxis sp. CP4 TaxID=2724527 RepID=UPI00210465F2|nr:molybdenum cofactor guanylyltransferase [Parasphingopyxis sp. CP4]